MRSLQRIFAVTVVLMVLLTGRAHAWNEDTHQSIVQFSYQLLNLADYEQNRNEEPDDSVVTGLFVKPDGADQAEWDDYVNVVSSARPRLAGLLIGGAAEGLDRHRDNILCAPEAPTHLGNIEEFTFGLIGPLVPPEFAFWGESSPIDDYNDNANVVPPCLTLPEYTFGGIYDDEKLVLEPGEGPHAGATLGYLAAGVDNRVRDWVQVIVPLEVPINAIQAELGLPLDSTESDVAVGTGITLAAAVALPLLFTLLSMFAPFLLPLLATAGTTLLIVLPAGFVETELPGFLVNPRDLVGLGHFIDMQPQVDAGNGLIPSNEFDDHQGKTLIQGYLHLGPNAADLSMDPMDHFILDKAKLGPTVDFDESYGAKNYQVKVADADDNMEASKSYRGEDYWDSTGIYEIAYTPVDNLAYHGWKLWRDDVCKKVESLHWPLHALGDAAAPHHVVGVTGFGHRPFEDVIQFAGQPALPIGGSSSQWNKLLYMENTVEAKKQARRIISNGYEWAKYIRDFQATAGHTGDIPIRQLVTAVAQRTLTMIHREAAPKIGCEVSACGLVGAEPDHTYSQDPSEFGDALETTTLNCDVNACEGLQVVASCDLLTCPPDQIIALAMSAPDRPSSPLPAIFPPHLSIGYNDGVRVEMVEYYTGLEMVNEQREFVEIATSVTLAFLAYAAERADADGPAPESCLCVDPLTSCGGTCVDTLSNDDHCGSCGAQCAGGESCCLGACVDLTTDEANCGYCGTTCEPAEECSLDQLGKGVCHCPGGVDGEYVCDGVCTDLSSDRFNCGWCGHTCQFQVCVSNTEPVGVCTDELE